jgi:hypothetical protein
MRFFDGRFESVHLSGKGDLRGDEILGIFPPGVSRTSASLKYVWLTFLVLITIVLIIGLFAIAIGSSGDWIIAFNCFATMFVLIIGIVGIPTAIAVFISYFIITGKQVKRTKTFVSSDHVEVHYWKGQGGVPVQVTRIPYNDIRMIRAINKEEWKKELRMKNLFRLITGLPYFGPSVRYLYGTPRKNIYTIIFKEQKEIHYFSEDQGATGAVLTFTVSAFFALTDRYLKDEKFYSDRIFFGLYSNDFVRLKRKIKENQLGYTEERRSTFLPPEIHPSLSEIYQYPSEFENIANN